MSKPRKSKNFTWDPPPPLPLKDKGKKEMKPDFPEKKLYHSNIENVVKHPDHNFNSILFIFDRSHLKI
jgi:hypothetical protein